MRVKIDGIITPDRVKNLLEIVQEYVTESVDAESVSFVNANIYFRIKDQDGNELDLIAQDGKELMIHFSAPKKSTVLEKSTVPTIDK